jgi:hypothetical protein
MGAVLAALAAVWGLAIRMLWNEWEIDPQYSYGFLVPLLCGVLFLKRWQDPSLAGFVGKFHRTRCGCADSHCLACRAATILRGKSRVAHFGIVGAVCAVGLTLLLIQAIGGTIWMRYFLSPVCFFLIAIPWPRNAEEAIMGFFMERNAMAALEVLHWCGYEAVRRGHLIALPGGTLGVEEACSGVEILQSGIITRSSLVKPFASGIHPGRAGRYIHRDRVAGKFPESDRAIDHCLECGFPAMEKWHDMAGLMILGFTLATLWGLAFFLESFAEVGVPLLQSTTQLHLQRSCRQKWLGPAFSPPCSPQGH